MNTDEEADKLLSDPHDIDGMAMDFVEQEVGRLDFLANWPNFFQRERRMAEWLKRYGYPSTDAAAVLARVEELHRLGRKWPLR